MPGIKLTRSHHAISVYFFIHLSSLVEEIKIEQYHCNHYTLANTGNDFLEAPNFDWSSVIIEMLSKKLSRLYIETTDNIFGYLPSKSVRTNECKTFFI